jgi:hypothetical protein
MPPRKNPVNVFISYAHEDLKYLKELRNNLAGLEETGHIKVWDDGKIIVGKPWDEQIRKSLLGADVVVLLITQNFMGSAYIVENELRLAREREQQGQIDLIPIKVEPYDFGLHWLGKVQAITVGGKSIYEARLRRAAWAKAAEALRVRIGLVDGGSPVSQVLLEMMEVEHSGQAPLNELPKSLPKPEVFPSVSEFWRARSLLPQTELVTVPGTLSQFAPVVMGPPLTKRLLHREFRRAIEKHRRFGESKRISINACLSISSGQMVYLARGNKPKRLLGFFEGIARNCIPVFVTNEYYEAEVLPKFSESGGRECFEATVTGRPFLLDNGFIRRFLTRQRLNRLLPAQLIDELSREAYALEVGGPGTGVQKAAGVPRYVDGDIWLAVQSDGKERFITGFVDITNAEERKEELERLREEAGGDTTLAYYDKPETIEQLLDTEERPGPQESAPR